MTSASVAPRHRAPSRWARWKAAGEDQIVTVTQLRTRNRDLLLQYQWVLHRREHASQARRITVVPRPHTAPD
jgi:hypothetical protein